jgi:hypothetical protein
MPAIRSVLRELRVVPELAAFVGTTPLARLAPGGDGHPVLVLPTRRIATTGPSVTVSTEGTTHVEVRALDRNGNQSASTVVTVNLDKTLPQVHLVSPADGATFVQHEEVAADYGCTDAGGSEIASCVGTTDAGSDIDTSTVGTRSFQVTATDSAGNQRVTTRTYTVVDVTPPEITIETPGVGAVFDRHQQVPADYACTDEDGGSGLAVCDGTVPDGDPVPTGTIGDQDFTVDAADNAGNLATLSRTYTVLDVTAPTVTIATPADGAVYDHHEAVTAAFTCEDEEGGSGIADGYCEGTAEDGSPIDTSTLGTRTFEVTATDRAGNARTVTHTYTVRDVTAPTVSSANEGIEYKLGQSVPAQFTCTDEVGGSGVASCEGPASLDTSSVGTKTFSVQTTDVAGNTHTEVVTYRVIYAYGEVRQPINPDGSSVFRAGSTVPVKFGLTDYQGTPVGSASPTISYTSFDPDGVVGDEEPEQVSTAPATGGTQLRWDASGRQYVFNLSTRNMAPGTYKLLITLDDAKQYSAVFTLR